MYATSSRPWRSQVPYTEKSCSGAVLGTIPVEETRSFVGVRDGAGGLPDGFHVRVQAPQIDGETWEAALFGALNVSEELLAPRP